jgi:hypothetical protein
MGQCHWQLCQQQDLGLNFIMINCTQLCILALLLLLSTCDKLSFIRFLLLHIVRKCLMWITSPSCCGVLYCVWWLMRQQFDVHARYPA